MTPWLEARAQLRQFGDMLQSHLTEAQKRQRVTTGLTLDELYQTGSSVRFGADLRELNALNSAGPDEPLLEEEKIIKRTEILTRLIDGLGEQGVGLVYRTWLNKQTINPDVTT